jgi:hypothetical protein
LLQEKKKGGAGFWKTWARGKKDWKCSFECIYDLFAILKGFLAVGSRIFMGFEIKRGGTWARGKKDWKRTLECIYDLFAFLKRVLAVGSARGKKDCKCTFECAYDLFAFLKGFLAVGSRIFRGCEIGGF